MGGGATGLDLSGAGSACLTLHMKGFIQKNMFNMEKLGSNCLTWGTQGGLV